MSNNKQSSVEWLENEFASLYFDYLTGLIDNKEYNERHKQILDKAKAMHQEEMVNSILDNRNITSQVTFKDAVQYYNETFGGQDEQ